MSWDAYPEFRAFGISPVPSAPLRSILPVYPDEFLLGAPLPIEQRLGAMLRFGLATSPARSAFGWALDDGTRASSRDAGIAETLSVLPPHKFLRALPLIESAPDPAQIPERIGLLENIERALADGARLGLVGQFFGSFVAPENFIIPGAGLGSSLMRTIVRQAAYGGAINLAVGVLDAFSLPADLRAPILEQVGFGIIAGAAIGTAAHLTPKIAVALSAAATARADDPLASLRVGPEMVRPFWEPGPRDRAPGEILREAFKSEDPEARAYSAAKLALRAESLVNEYHDTLRSIAGLSVESAFERAVAVQNNLLRQLKGEGEFVEHPSSAPSRLRILVASDAGDAASRDARAIGDLVRSLLDEIGLFEVPALVRISDDAPDVPTMVPTVVSGDDSAILSEIERVAKSRASALSVRGAQVSRLADPETGIWTGGVAIDISPSWLNAVRSERGADAAIVEAVAAIAHEVGHVVAMRALSDAPEEIIDILARDFAREMKLTTSNRKLAELLASADLPAGAGTIFDSVAEALYDRGMAWRGPALVAFREWLAVQVSRWALLRLRKEEVGRETAEPLNQWLRRYGVGQVFVHVADRMLATFRAADAVLAKTMPGTRFGGPTSDVLRKYLVASRGNALKGALIDEAQRIHSFAEWVIRNYDPSLTPREARWAKLRRVIDEIGERHKASREEKAEFIERLFFDQRKIGFLLPEIAIHGQDIFAVRGASRATPGSMVVQGYLVAPFKTDVAPSAEERLVDQPRAFSPVGAPVDDDVPPTLPPLLEGLSPVSAFVLSSMRVGQRYGLWSMTDAQRKRIETLRERARRIERDTGGKVTADEVLAGTWVYAPTSGFISDLWAPIVVVRPAKPGTKPLSLIIRGVLDPRDARALLEPIPAELRKDLQALGTVVVEFPASEIMAKSGEPPWRVNEIIETQLAYARVFGALHAVLPTLLERASSAEFAWLKNGGPPPGKIKTAAIDDLERALSRSSRFAKRASVTEIGYQLSNKEIADVARFVARASALIDKHLSEVERGSREHELFAAARSALQLLARGKRGPDHLEFALWLSRAWHFGEPETFASVSTVAERERQRRLDAMRDDLFRRDPMIRFFGLSALTSDMDIDGAIEDAFKTLRGLKEEARATKAKPRAVKSDVEISEAKPVADLLNEIAADLRATLREASIGDGGDKADYWRSAFAGSLYRAFVDVHAIGRAIVERAMVAGLSGVESIRDAIVSVITDRNPSGWFALLSSVSDVAAAIRVSYERWVSALSDAIPDPQAREIEVRRSVAAMLGPYLPSDSPNEPGGHVGLATLEIIRDREETARRTIDEIEGAIRTAPEQLPPQNRPADEPASRFRRDRLIDRVLGKIRWKQMPWWVLTNNGFDGEVGDAIARAAHAIASVPGLELEGNARGRATVLDSVEARATVYQSAYIAAEATHRAAMVESMGRPFMMDGPARARLIEFLERISPTAAKSLVRGERTPIMWDIHVRRVLTNPEEPADAYARKAARAWREFFDKFLEHGARAGVFVVDRHKDLALNALQARLERWKAFRERIIQLDSEVFRGVINRDWVEFAKGLQEFEPKFHSVAIFARSLLDVADEGIRETEKLVRLAVENPPKVMENYVPRLWMKGEIRRRRAELDAILARYGISSPLERAQIISILADDPLRDRLNAIADAIAAETEKFGVRSATEFKQRVESVLREVLLNVEPSRMEIEVASLLGRRIERRWTSDLRKALVDGFIDAARAAGASEEQALAIRSEVNWGLIWEGLHTDRPLFEPDRSTRFAYERTLANIPDSVLLDAGFIDPTITGTAGVYLRDVSRAIAFAELFGDPSGTLGIANVLLDAVRQMARHAVDDSPTSEAKVYRLAEEYRRVSDAFVDLRDLVLLRAGLPDDPDAISARAVQFATASAVAAQMGMAVFSALADVGRIAMAVGLKKAGIAAMFSMFDRQLRDIGKAEANAIGLAADVVLSGRTRGWFEQMTISRDRLAIERWAQIASEIVPIASLLAPWTDLASQWATVAIGSELIRLSLAITQRTATPDDVRRAAMFGIDADFAEAIVREWKAAGGQRIERGGVVLYLPSTNNWASADVVTRWRSTLASLVQAHGVIRANAADVPKFFKTPLGRALFLYRSFSLAATWKILASGIQQADAYVLSGMLSMIAIAYLVETMMESKYEIKSATHRLLRAIERSGAIGIISDVNRTLSAASSGAIDLRRVLGVVPGLPSVIDLRPPIRSRAARELEDRLSALSGAAIGPWIRLSGALLEGGPLYPKTIRAVRQMIWGQNLLWWRFAVDSLEREVVSFVR